MLAGDAERADWNCGKPAVGDVASIDFTVQPIASGRVWLGDSTKKASEFDEQTRWLLN